MKLKFLTTTVLLSSVLLANNDVTLEWLKDKPRTYAKDFYIWQFLNQDISPSQAIEALGQAYYVNDKLFYSYAKKIKHDETHAVMECMQASANSLVNSNADCIEVGLSTYKATKLKNTQLNRVYETLLNTYPKTASIIDVVGASIPFTKLISSDNDTFFDVFNECGSNFRTNYFNYKIPHNTLKRILEDERFNQTIKLIVTNNKLSLIQKSLLELDDTNLNHKSSFFLGINALKHSHNELALKYFHNAEKKAYFQFDKDKVSFWKFLTTKNKFYLFDLSNSWDINIYSLYAKEFFNKSIKENIIHEVSMKNKDSENQTLDTSNPFFWIPILNDIKNFNEDKLSKYENMFTEDDTLSHLTFIYERYYRYKKSFFITPYKKHLEDLSPDRQALIYSIARQESRFIPSSVSTAYAMGIMQIMPFLSKAIAKELEEDYIITDQFKPDVNIKYANFHLNYLESEMKHPLLIAYAYNGGIGFTRRMIKNGLFNSEGENKELEPFLSMELIPYDETRKYGKKVLANYYIYKNYLDTENQVTIKALFEKLLMQP